MAGGIWPKGLKKTVSLLGLLSLCTFNTVAQSNDSLDLKKQRLNEIYQTSKVPVFVNKQDQNNDKFIDKLEFYHYSDSLITYKVQDIISNQRPRGFAEVAYTLQTKYLYNLENNTVTEQVKKQDFIHPPKLISSKTVPISKKHYKEQSKNYVLTKRSPRLFIDFDDFNFNSLQAIIYDSEGKKINSHSHSSDDALVALGAEPYYTNEEDYYISTTAFDPNNDGRPDSVKISYTNPFGMQMCSITRIDGDDNDGYVNYDIITVHSYNANGKLQSTKRRRHNLTGDHEWRLKN